MHFATAAVLVDKQGVDTDGEASFFWVVWRDL